MKKVLIITYYWPPAGGISLHRCLKFAKYLPQFGWEPVVFTAKDAQYPYFDESNFKDIPEGITILKYPIVEPFNLFKKVSGRKKEESLNNIVHVRDKKGGWIDEAAIWIRGNFFIPDARALWIKPSVKFLHTYLQENPVDAVLSDGPPHTNTRIAYHLSKKLNIPFLADFQDPWTQVDYYPLMKLTPWADRRHKKMEQEVFSQADKITIASPSWKEDLQAIGARNVDVVYWGYDEDDFKNLKRQADKAFTITHTGLLGYDRLPDGLFQALKELKEEVPSFARDLQIQLAGQVDYSVLEMLEKLELEKNLINKGTIPREEVLQLLVNSQVLLLPLNKSRNAKGRLPGKLYEYLRARRPVLGLGPRDSDASAILEQTKAGEVFAYSETGAIKSWVSEAYKRYKEGELPDCSGPIEAYAVSEQTGKVAAYLNQITKGRAKG